MYYEPSCKHHLQHDEKRSSVSVARDESGGRKRENDFVVTSDRILGNTRHLPFLYK